MPTMKRLQPLMTIKVGLMVGEEGLPVQAVQVGPALALADVDQVRLGLPVFPILLLEVTTAGRMMTAGRGANPATARRTLQLTTMLAPNALSPRHLVLPQHVGPLEAKLPMILTTPTRSPLRDCCKTKTAHSEVRPCTPSLSSSAFQSSGSRLPRWTLR